MVLTRSQTKNERKVFDKSYFVTFIMFLIKSLFVFFKVIKNTSSNSSPSKFELFKKANEDSFLNLLNTLDSIVDKSSQLLKLMESKIKNKQI
jgi:hypothetical protein